MHYLQTNIAGILQGMYECFWKNQDKVSLNTGRVYCPPSCLQKNTFIRITAPNNSRRSVLIARPHPCGLFFVHNLENHPMAIRRKVIRNLGSAANTAIRTTGKGVEKTAKWIASDPLGTVDYTVRQSNFRRYARTSTTAMPRQTCLIDAWSDPVTIFTSSSIPAIRSMSWKSYLTGSLTICSTWRTCYGDLLNQCSLWFIGAWFGYCWLLYSTSFSLLGCIYCWFHSNMTVPSGQ